MITQTSSLSKHTSKFVKSLAIKMNITYEKAKIIHMTYSQVLEETLLEKKKVQIFKGLSVSARVTYAANGRQYVRVVGIVSLNTRKKILISNENH